MNNAFRFELPAALRQPGLSARIWRPAVGSRLSFRGGAGLPGQQGNSSTDLFNSVFDISGDGLLEGLTDKVGTVYPGKVEAPTVLQTAEANPNNPHLPRFFVRGRFAYRPSPTGTADFWFDPTGWVPIAPRPGSAPGVGAVLPGLDRRAIAFAASNPYIFLGTGFTLMPRGLQRLVVNSWNDRGALAAIHQLIVLTNIHESEIDPVNAGILARVNQLPRDASDGTSPGWNP